MIDFLYYCYYFGTYKQPGHYLHAPNMGQAGYSDRHSQMTYLDGELAPKNSGQRQFEAKCWRLTGFSFGDYSAMSWWDRTDDHRMGSNGIIFIPGYKVGQITMVSLAGKYFPQISDRISKLTILPGFDTYSKGTNNA